MTIKTVEVKFEGSYGKTYNYLTDLENLKLGDKVIVDSSNGLGIANVIQYTDKTDSTWNSWIVQKIDLEAHEERKEKL